MAHLSAQEDGAMSSLPQQRWSDAEALAMQLHAFGDLEINSYVSYVRTLVNAVTSIRLASDARRRWVERNGAGCPDAEKMSRLIESEMDRADDMAHRIIGLIASVREASASPLLPAKRAEAAAVSTFRSAPGLRTVRREEQAWVRHG
nr:hypothetical protein [Azospirillum sp. 412522]